MSVKITKDRIPAMLKAIKDLTSLETLVGVPAENAGREGSSINNAAIGYLMETGSPSQNIPARPFLVPGIEAALPKIEKRLRAGAMAALGGDAAAGKNALTGAGLAAESSVKTVMHSNVGPPLSARTLYNRKHRKGQKNQRENTLVDTTDLINHITHVVRKKGDN